MPPSIARPVGVSSVDILSSLGRRIQPSASNARSAVTRTQSRSALMPEAARLARCPAPIWTTTSICTVSPGVQRPFETETCARHAPWVVCPAPENSKGTILEPSSTAAAVC